MYYRIGQVAEQLSLTEHTVRQWARRYEIGASHRSEGGQRLYSEQDLSRLRLIQKGRSQGHRLADMAQLPHAALKALIEPHPEQVSIYWQGPSLQRFRASFADVEWLVEDPCDSSEALRIFELDTVTETDLAELSPVSQGRSTVIYQYASRPMQKQLLKKGYELVRGPANEDWLLQMLQSRIEHRQFSDRELQQLQQIQPDLECECPNHVAAILKQLRHFARYSLECDVQSPQQGWVHQQIFQHIRHAQQDVEAALRLIVEEEGL